MTLENSAVLTLVFDSGNPRCWCSRHVEFRRGQSTVSIVDFSDMPSPSAVIRRFRLIHYMLTP